MKENDRVCIVWILIHNVCSCNYDILILSEIDVMYVGMYICVCDSNVV